MSKNWDPIIHQLANGNWIIASATVDGWRSEDNKFSNEYLHTELEELGKMLTQYPTKDRARTRARTRYPIGSKAYIQMTNQNG